MGRLAVPKVYGFERCDRCGAVLWKCRVHRSGTIGVDPHRVPGGGFEVMANGRLILGRAKET
jgi:hypothetical protein